jgi:hypothetical protein
VTLAGQAATVETVLSLAEVVQVQRARARGDGGGGKEEEKEKKRHVSFLTDRLPDLPTCQDRDRLSAYVVALSELPDKDSSDAPPPRHGEEKGLGLSLQGRVDAPPPLKLELPSGRARAEDWKHHPRTRTGRR